jgi:NAD(P)-dependent dehydrogenase (short-subunit alcohol dehydrogenase family)
MKVYVITGPTSGIGLATAMELAKHGMVILVGRNQEKLNKVQHDIVQTGQKALSVICDLSDIISVRRAAKQIIDLGLPIAGVLNNAGIMAQKPKKSAQGWDMSYATNHLGPFAFTEALAPHLPDGANVLFVASAIEDPERKPVKMMGLKGARYISAEASARGEWQTPGSKMPGMDAYSTTKQCILVAAMALAREIPRLHINAVEPGITSGTNLGGEDTSAFVRLLAGKIMGMLPAVRPYKSTPKKSAKTIAGILTDTSGKTGVYFDEKGRPMQASKQAQDRAFQDRVVAETRALLSKV